MQAKKLLQALLVGGSLIALAACSTPITESRQEVREEVVRFSNENGIKINAAGQEALRKHAAILYASGANAILEGHTSLTADQAYNQKLGLVRANQVAEFLTHEMAQLMEQNNDVYVKASGASEAYTKAPQARTSGKHLYSFDEKVAMANRQVSVISYGKTRPVVNTINPKANLMNRRVVLKYNIYK